MINKILIFSVFLFTSLLGHSANIVINPISGFSDSTATSAIGGNPGLTLGAQRLNAFQKAADILETFLDIQVDVKVDASFSLLACNANSAVLGSAGAAGGTWNFPGAPLANTIYPLALANNLANSDINGVSAEIGATFNSSIDNNANCLNGVDWYYGYDDPATAGAQYTNDTSFLSVAIHEMLHGLGVSSWVLSTGALNSGLMDSYSANLYDQSTNKSWGSMNNGERLTSMTNSNNLVWSGTNVNNSNAAAVLTNGINNGKVEMYAPASYEQGSSISHFSKDATPNEIMEPNYTELLTTPGMATQLLQDMGWAIHSLSNSAPVLDAIGAQTTTEDNNKTITLSAVDDDGDDKTFTASSDNASVSTSVTGATLTLTPAANYFGSANITVTVSDGTDTDSETFILTVASDNDLPVFTSSNNLTTLYSNTLVHSLIATDADSDGLSFSLAAFNSAHLSVLLSDSSLTINASNNFIGTTALQVAVFDGTATTLQTINVQVFDDLKLISDSNNLSDGTHLDIAYDDFEFSLAGGDSSYSIDVLFDGQEVSSELLTFSAGNYYLAMPESGAFAGSYTFTVTDGLGESAVFSISRPLKVSTNINQLITGSSSQQLYIEGAPAGSLLDLHIVQGIGLIDLMVDEAIATQVVAPDNAELFNRAIVNINVNDATAINNITISADHASLPAGDTQLTTLPFHDVALTVKGASNTAINASIQVSDDRFMIWGLAQQRITNSLGELVLSLPNDQPSSLIVGADYYQSQSVAVDVETDLLEVVLDLIENPMMVSGTITTSSLNFLTQVPLVELIADDGSIVLAELNNLSTSSVSYSVTTNTLTFNAKILRVSRGDISQQINLLNNQLDSTINIQIDAIQVVDVAAQPTTQPNAEPIIEVTAPAAGNNLLLLLLSLILLIFQRKRKAEVFLT